MALRPSIVGALVVVAVATAATSVRAHAAPQIRAGVLATWKDMDTWSSYIEDGRQTEKGLGLVLGGSGGETRVSFVARLEGRYPNKPPKAVAVEGAVDPHINPNTLRTPTLRFLISAGAEKSKTMDLSGRMTVDNPAPGAMVNDAVAQITPKEFSALAFAKSVRANVFMVDVEFRPDQLRALDAFARSLFLSKP